MKNIFEKRIAYKPFEYPEVMDFINTLNQTFWVHSEVDFTGDLQDFNVNFSENEKNAVKNTLIAIAQIEVSVKTFWGNLYQELPKPEINGLGSTFAECEFRHSEAYSRLLDVLGFQNAFEDALQTPILQERIAFLSNPNKRINIENPNRAFAVNLIIFSLLVENVSLFSQFAVILSFTHFKGLLKNTSNIIAWTSKDEQIHANAGIYLFNQIIKENPEWLDHEMINIIKETAYQAIEQESKIIDWIFEKGEIELINKKQLLNFMKQRVNESLEEINIEPIFEINQELIQQMNWFEEEIFAQAHDDFFAKRPVNYSKHNQSFSVHDLF